MYQVHFLKDNKRHFVWCVSKTTAHALKKELNGVIVKEKLPAVEKGDINAPLPINKKARRLLKISEGMIDKDLIPAGHYAEIFKHPKI